MNQMRKEMIVKKFLFLVVLLVLISCSKKISEDIELLNLVLSESSYKLDDSIHLIKESDNSKIILFFKLRNIQESGLSFFKKINDSNQLGDSLVKPFDSVVSKPLKIKSNQYLIRGKGINEKTEVFLKDSFNYAQSNIIWNFHKTSYNVAPIEDSVSNFSRLKISKPVYNLNNNKAIIFKTLMLKKGKQKNTIYFLEKTKNKWHILYNETLESSNLFDKKLIIAKE